MTAMIVGTGWSIAASAPEIYTSWRHGEWTGVRNSHGPSTACLSTDAKRLVFGYPNPGPNHFRWPRPVRGRRATRGLAAWGVEPQRKMPDGWLRLGQSEPRRLHI